MTLRAVLFDSGGVLMQPIGGRWNPPAYFESRVLDHAPHLGPERIADGIAAGDRFMAASTSTPDYDDYYRVILAALDVASPDQLLADLNRPVDPRSVVETFPEVLDVIAELRRRGVRMAVVSDAWPGLPDLHAALGMIDCFEVYAISAVLGCTKPDPRMYRHASDGLGLVPSECLFVDDDPDLVAAALALGYEGRAVIRAGEPNPAGVAAIETLAEVLDLF